MSENKKTVRATDEQAMEYPGVARSEGDTPTPCHEKEATKELNNNPRNNDL